jgi:hypothetical protein
VVFGGGFGLNTVNVKFPLNREQLEEYVTLDNQQRPPADPRPLYQISRGPNPVTYQIQPNGTSSFLGTNYSARSMGLWDPNLRNPCVLHWNLGTQYEINPVYSLELVHEGSVGVGLIERWQINSFPVDYAKADPTLQAAVLRTPQNYRPFPNFGDILLRSNSGHSTYHLGTVKLEKRYSAGVNLSTFYTFSTAIDSQDNDNDGTGVAPIQSRSLEKALAGCDRRHRFVAAATYELPVGKGKWFLNRGGVWNHIFGGFEIAWVQTFESGNPLTFSFANSPFNYYPTFAGSRHPNVVGTPRLRDDWRDFGGERFNVQNINPVIDINYFAYPDAFTVGNAGRSIVTGPPLRGSTAGAKENFQVSERVKLQVRWDYQNPLKMYNLNNPTTTVEFLNPRTFGKITSDRRRRLAVSP